MGHSWTRTLSVGHQGILSGSSGGDFDVRHHTRGVFHCSQVVDQLHTGRVPLGSRYTRLLSHISFQENAEESPAAMCLVGNKQDMDAMKEREVSTETGETFAKVLLVIR